MNRIIEIALTDLATKLDVARKAANDIEETAPQSGVYGDISDALGKTLALLVDSDRDRSNRLYDLIIDDANTVAEALAIESLEHASLEEELKTFAGRVQVALRALDRRGVPETRVQTESGLSDERWSEITATENVETPRIRVREVHQLADALLLDPTYLLTGDRTYSTRYSPCYMDALIGGRYPKAG